MEKRKGERIISQERSGGVFLPVFQQRGPPLRLEEMCLILPPPLPFHAAQLIAFPFQFNRSVKADLFLYAPEVIQKKEERNKPRT